MVGVGSDRGARGPENALIWAYLIMADDAEVVLDTQAPDEAQPVVVVLKRKRGRPPKGAQGVKAPVPTQPTSDDEGDEQYADLQPEEALQEGLTTAQIQDEITKAWSKKKQKVFWWAEQEEFVIICLANHMKSTNATMKERGKKGSKGSEKGSKAFSRW